MTDSLGCHKSAAVRAAIEAADAELRLLPPYSPDFNPIEQAFGRFKRIAFRCGKTKRNFGSFVALAAAFIGVKFVQTD